MIKRILVISAIALTILAFEHQPSFSQVTQQWVARYNGPGNLEDFADNASSPAVDGFGNVYVTGSSKGSGTYYDYATIKYNSSGVQQWVVRYNGPGNSSDAARSLAVDGSGNVYVTGFSYVSGGTSSDYATIKYNSAGVQQWVARYNGPGNSGDGAYSLAVDVSGNVYVTGESLGSGTSLDYATIKYNSSGVQQWVARYNGPGDSIDYASSLAVDGSGNVYVTGESLGSGTSSDYATIKYNSSGVQQWVARYNSPGNNDDFARSLAVDGSGNVYVRGSSYGSGTSYDYATIKYNSSGVQQWVARYNGPGNLNDFAFSLAVDASDNVYVTGSSSGLGTGYDYATIKYNSAGVQEWIARYNGPGNNYDEATSLAVDGSGNVYVTGESLGTGTSYDYATIKYNSSGIQQWIARYNGPGNSYDYAYSLAVDGSGNVYVTGSSYGSGTSIDYATIKYSQQSQPIPLPSISISPIQINPGENINITGQNFRASAQVKINVLSSTSQTVLDQTYTTNSVGGFSASYFSNAGSSPGIYTVSAYDIATNQTAPNKIFEVIEPPETFELKLTSPKSDSVDRVINVEWIDKMIPGIGYPIDTIRRFYKYKINFSSDDGISWSSDIISEGFKYVNNTQLFNQQISLPTLTNPQTVTKFKVKVTDYITPSRYSESAAIPIKTSGLTKSKINLLWDNSYSQPGIAPIGVCADGVSRIYFKISKLNGQPAISSVIVKLDNTGNDTRYLGKLQIVADTVNYDSSANNASSIQATNSNKTNYWFWYVSPDDFVKTGLGDETKIERIVVARVLVNYSDGTSENGSQNITIVRPPLVMVHGWNSDPDKCWDDFKYFDGIGDKYFKNDQRFKTILRPRINPKGSFNENSDLLLNWTQFSVNPPNKNSLLYACYDSRSKGYACSQVYYVSHSMGGSVIRTASEKPYYKSFRNYGKGYVNKIITIDTPHEGTPLADALALLTPIINVNGNIRDIINNKINKNENSLLRNSFDKGMFDLIVPSSAVKNLQSKFSGKYVFKETRIPSYLIASDAFPGTTGNFEDYDLNIRFNHEFEYILTEFNELFKIPGIITMFELNIADYFLNSISDRFKRICKLLYSMYNFLNSDNNNILNSDMVVSNQSQLAHRQRFDNVNTFSQHQDDGALGVFHAFYHECTSDSGIGNKVFDLLNLPSNDLSFKYIDASSSNSLNFDNISGNNSVQIDTISTLNILTPSENENVFVDSILNVTLTITDTTNLKFINLYFQNENYYDTVKSFTYNFNINVNGSELDSCLLSAQAVYKFNDTVKYSSSLRNLFVKSNQTITDFRVTNNFYFIGKNDLIFPDYFSVFNNHICEGVLNNISAIVANPSVIMFDNTSKSFKAISSGETFAIVSNGGQSDTIYFSVNGEILSPGNTDLVYPVDQSFVPSSDLKLSWKRI